MDVDVFAEVPSRRYFRALYYLRDKGRIDRLQLLGLIDFIKHPIKILRSLNNDVQILGCSPYHLLVYHSYLHHLLNKTNVFSTTWPYWDGKNCVWGHHDSIRRWVWNKYLVGRKTIAITRPAQRALQAIGILAHYIPHPVDTDFFRPQKWKKQGTTKILFVGRMVEEKGILILLESAKELKDKDVVFWFVGKGRLDGRIKKAEKKLPVKHLGYIGNRHKLLDTYNKADILVLPSIRTQVPSFECGHVWEELFGIVLIEAMSCGLPVIATDCIGPKEIVKNGVNGYIVSQRNVKQLVEKLEILVNSPKSRKIMGAKGRRLAEECYDIKDIAKKWLRVLGD